MSSERLYKINNIPLGDNRITDENIEKWNNGSSTSSSGLTNAQLAWLYSVAEQLEIAGFTNKATFVSAFNYSNTEGSSETVDTETATYSDGTLTIEGVSTITSATFTDGVLTLT